MSKRVCPQSIQDLFIDTPGEGRLKAIEWVESLALTVGDEVFLPELGWLVKTEGGLQ